MRSLYQIAGTLIFVMAIGVPVAGAQQEPQPQQPERRHQRGAHQPIPAYKSPLASQADNGEGMSEPVQLGPDNRPLTGIQELSLGVPLDRHSYWQPHAEIDFTGDSEAPQSGGTGGWSTWTTVVGGVDLHRFSGQSELTFEYLGGGVFSNNGSAGNGVLQDANFDAAFSFRRWTLTLIDELRYTPELAFGNVGFGGIASLLPVQTSLPFGDTQTILSALGQRLSNATGAQADLKLSRKSSLTFSGGYSELYFFDQDLLNSTAIYVQGGYNHQLGRTDTLGVSYVYNGIRYSNFSQSIDSHSGLLSYGRRITGRLAFQIAAGPQFAHFATGLSCITGVGGSPCGSSSQLLWALNTSLNYQLQKTGISATYAHGVVGGSGVLAGAIGDSVLGTVSRQISRTFNGEADLGYSRNKGLAVAFANVPTLNGTFDYWTVGGHLTHPWGRTLQLFL